MADDILDETEYPYTVYYQSANTAQNTIGQPQYVIESTQKGSRLTGADMPDQYLPLTSIPSVVLVGQYKIGRRAISFYTYQKDENGLPQIYVTNDGYYTVSASFTHKYFDNFDDNANVAFTVMILANLEGIGGRHTDYPPGDTFM